jgi:hypothetical protein
MLHVVFMNLWMKLKSSPTYQSNIQAIGKFWKLISPQFYEHIPILPRFLLFLSSFTFIYLFYFLQYEAIYSHKYKN